ncbi:hypothetical protein E2C01_101503 [Portunus trituberculatus]|uniref:Uncharacterized protein n=1 Tax=Portunus trituberculatus TaxID=210409 RepID=A0A5B7KAX5_PORTR|nr:hypothetical protein [Portunus trituberculatus]
MTPLPSHPLPGCRRPSQGESSRGSSAIVFVPGLMAGPSFYCENSGCLGQTQPGLRPGHPCTARRPVSPRSAHSRRDTQREAARTDASVGGATAGIIHYKGFALPRGTSAHSGAAVARPGHATLATAAPRRAAHFPFRDGSHA